MRKFGLMIIISFTGNVFAANNSGKLDSDYNLCKELDEYGKIYICAQEIFIKADMAVNEEYKSLAQYLKIGARIQFVESQKKWIDFRESNCLFASPVTNITYKPELAARASCLARETLHRLKELEDFNSWRGNNGSPW